jgi:N-acetylglucosamine malate deacetylase 1
MIELSALQNVLVIAPHPDDEVLGVGGTMARLRRLGAKVRVAIMTRGHSPLFDPEVSVVGRREAREAHSLLGVAETRFLDFPAAELDGVAHQALNREIEKLVTECRPDAVFVPFVGDIHQDHKEIFDSTLVAVRPNRAGYPAIVMAYETLSETNWNAPYLTPAFNPNVFVDVADTLEVKLEAMRAFASQSKAFPHERSEETIRALATLRGSTVFRQAAEAFVLVRGVL